MRYRRGQISYKEWAETDAGSWAGEPLSQVMTVLEKIPYRDGARELFQELKRRGVKTAILSAGLSILADKAAAELGADLAVSNELETNDGRLTGGIRVKVAVDNKKEVIEQIAGRLKVPLRSVALVGDQAFDLSHDDCLKIAFRPKNEIVKHEADFVVEDDDLTRILQYVV